MNTNFESRWAISPSEARQMDTAALRENFLIDNLFQPGSIRLVLSHFDRFITGGIMPVDAPLTLTAPDAIKAPYFLERRELGVINVGGKGIVTADGVRYEVDYKEA